LVSATGASTSYDQDTSSSTCVDGSSPRIPTNALTGSWSDLTAGGRLLLVLSCRRFNGFKGRRGAVPLFVLRSDAVDAAAEEFPLNDVRGAYPVPVDGLCLCHLVVCCHNDIPCIPSTSCPRNKL
jgi:hypothetical protein